MIGTALGREFHRHRNDKREQRPWQLNRRCRRRTLDGDPNGFLRPSFELLEDRRLLDITPFSVPLIPWEPAGSLMYRSTSWADISVANEVDSFTIDLDSGQIISVGVDPAQTLQPSMELFDPAGVSIAQAVATNVDEDTGLLAIPVNDTGTYTVSLTGAAETTGSYSLVLALNSSLEVEGHFPGNNDDLATAEDLDDTFIALDGTQALRGAVFGEAAGDDDYYSFTLEAGDSASLVVNSQSRVQLELALFDDAGTLLALGEDGW